MKTLSFAGIFTKAMVGQRVLVVNKYLQDHPEDLNLPDALLVSVALEQPTRTAWPASR
jgi:hypothetical protein